MHPLCLCCVDIPSGLILWVNCPLRWSTKTKNCGPFSPVRNEDVRCQQKVAYPVSAAKRRQRS